MARATMARETPMPMPTPAGVLRPVPLGEAGEEVVVVLEEAGSGGEVDVDVGAEVVGAASSTKCSRGSW